jgi:hypothetical protein
MLSLREAECLCVKVVGKAFMSAVRQEIRLSQEAAKRHAESRGTAHAAESLRYRCGSGSARIRKDPHPDLHQIKIRIRIKIYKLDPDPHPFADVKPK